MSHGGKGKRKKSRLLMAAGLTRKCRNACVMGGIIRSSRFWLAGEAAGELVAGKGGDTFAAPSLPKPLRPLTYAPLQPSEIHWTRKPGPTPPSAHR